MRATDQEEMACLVQEAAEPAEQMRLQRWAWARWNRVLQIMVRTWTFILSAVENHWAVGGRITIRFASDYVDKKDQVDSPIIRLLLHREGTSLIKNIFYY